MSVMRSVLLYMGAHLDTGLLPVDAKKKDKDDETLMIPDNVSSILVLLKESSLVGYL